MKLAIIGIGNVGSRLAKLFLLANHEVFLGSRDANKAGKLAATLGEGAKGMTYVDAVAAADVILITTVWANNITLDAVGKLGDLTNKIVVDCTNPLSEDYMSNTLDYTTSASEEIAKLLPNVPIVKAFNTIFAEVMEPGKQTFDEYKGTGFYCGNDAKAKEIVANLIKDAGFDPVDAGVLQNAKYLESMAQLNIQIAYGLGGGTDVAFRYMRR